MLKSLLSVLVILLGFAINTANTAFSQSTPVWTGAVSNDWATAGNWDISMVPGAGDTVTIPSTPTGTNGFPILSSTSAPVLSITMESGTSLEITSSGTLNLFGPNDDFDYGIELQGMATLTNNGTVNIDSSSDGISTVNAGNLINNNAGAVLNITRDGSDPIIMDDSSGTFNNYGTITLNTFDNDGIDMNEGSVFVNHASGSITVTDGGGELLETDGSFTNNGTLICTETIGNTDGADGICLRSDGSFYNTGTIQISGLKDGNSLELDGPFTNEGIVTMAQGPAPGDNHVIQVENDGSLINAICGILNVTTLDSVVVQSGGSWTNNGIFATSYTGENTNSGSITNNGEIRNSAGTFQLTSGSNAITGSGAVVIGTSPTSTPLGSCTTTTPVPTLSQWGLILFGLVLLCIGGIVIWNKGRQVKGAVS